MLDGPELAPDQLKERKHETDPGAETRLLTPQGMACVFARLRALTARFASSPADSQHLTAPLVELFRLVGVHYSKADDTGSEHYHCRHERPGPDAAPCIHSTLVYLIDTCLALGNMSHAAFKKELLWVLCNCTCEPAFCELVRQDF